MRKSAAVGSTTIAAATFTVGFTSTTEGEFKISLGSTETRLLKKWNMYMIYWLVLHQLFIELWREIYLFR